jgi:hypothetical protein
MSNNTIYMVVIEFEDTDLNPICVRPYSTLKTAIDAEEQFRKECKDTGLDAQVYFYGVGMDDFTPLEGLQDELDDA